MYPAAINMPKCLHYGSRSHFHPGPPSNVNTVLYNGAVVYEQHVGYRVGVVEREREHGVRLCAFAVGSAICKQADTHTLTHTAWLANGFGAEPASFGRLLPLLLQPCQPKQSSPQEPTGAGGECGVGEDARVGCLRGTVA